MNRSFEITFNFYLLGFVILLTARIISEARKISLTGLLKFIVQKIDMTPPENFVLKNQDDFAILLTLRLLNGKLSTLSNGRFYFER